MLRFAAKLLPVAMFLLAAETAAQSYPAKPVRIVTSEPGSGIDLVARLVAQGLTDALGRQVIVENRGGMMAGDVVLRAAPDGYTLLVSGTSLWLAPFMRESATHDPIKDFSPITLAATSPNVLAVHPSLPAESVMELIALAKARPGELNYGSGSTGAPTHLAAELFKALSGVNIVRIPYKGTGPAMNALMAGQVQLMFVSTSSVAPHVKAGRLKALAVTSAQSSPLAPGLPTVASTGLPGYEAASMVAVLAPAKTPKPLIDRLNREVVQLLGKAQVRERLFSSGAEAVGSSPEALAAAMKSDMAKWGKLIKAAGIREQ